MIFSSSYILNPVLFSWVFGLALGILTSGIFLPSVWILWNNLSENKAFNTGFMLAGFSAGGIPFAIMFTMVVNPNNHSTNEVEHDEKMFGSEVAQRVPMTIRWLSACYLVVIIIGMLLLPKKASTVNSAPITRKSQTMKEIMKTRYFWNLFFMLLLSMACQGYVFVFYKVVALKYINDDYYSSLVGILSFLFGAIGRILFGILLGKFHWKQIMSLVYFIETLLLISFWFALNDKALYAFYVVSFIFLSTSCYNNVLILAQKAFPDSKAAISGISFSLVFCSFIPYLVDKFITPIVGYFFSFFIFAVFTFILLIQLMFYTDPKQESLLDVENSID